MNPPANKGTALKIAMGGLAAGVVLGVCLFFCKMGITDAD